MEPNSSRHRLHCGRTGWICHVFTTPFGTQFPINPCQRPGRQCRQRSAGGCTGILSVFLRIAGLPFAVLIDAACNLVAALLYGYLGRTHQLAEFKTRIPAAAPKVARKAFLRPFLKAFEGKARPLLMLLLVVTLLNGAVLAELPFYMVHNLGIAPYLVSLITALGAIGGVGSGLLVGPIATRHGWRAVTRIGLFLLSLSMVGLPFACRGGWGVFCCLIYELFGSFGGVLTSWLQSNLAYDRLARGIAGAALIPELGHVSGALLGASLAGIFGVRSLLFGVAILGILVGSLRLWAMSEKLVGLRTMDDLSRRRISVTQIHLPGIPTELFKDDYPPLTAAHRRQRYLAMVLDWVRCETAMLKRGLGTMRFRLPRAPLQILRESQRIPTRRLPPPPQCG